MRLLSYLDAGRSTYGALVDDERVVELPAADASLPPTLRDALGSLGALRAAAAAGAPGPSLGDLELLPVIPEPNKIICVGVNYVDHRNEMGREEVSYPTLFARFSDSQVGHDRPVGVPAASSKLDYEGELAVVIGEPVTAAVDASGALAHVVGYACFDDLSVRDDQRHTSQWLPGKNFHGIGAFGPVLVTADEAPALGQMHLETRVNGEVRQSAPVSDLIFGVPQLIEYVSSFTRLATGDVIVTGTPAGVGVARNPPLFLVPGDVVEVEITGVGLLRTPIV